ncbi:hypothetical protein GC170_19700 [bacterium]|nr:hypothetical protein [bacterium]
MFEEIKRGRTYSRPQLAELWGYSSFHALARGVITPRGSNKIILFVTEEKQQRQEQYQNSLIADKLLWEGPTDHFAEDRMISASTKGDEIHLFHRNRHHSDFTYFGQIFMQSYQLFSDKPSRFTFSIEK